MCTAKRYDHNEDHGDNNDHGNDNGDNGDTVDDNIHICTYMYT